MDVNSIHMSTRLNFICYKWNHVGTLLLRQHNVRSTTIIESIILVKYLISVCSVYSLLCQPPKYTHKIQSDNFYIFIYIYQVNTKWLKMNPYPLFFPPPLWSKTQMHINKPQEAIIDTTIQGPAPVASIDPSQGSFTQISESPD